MKKSRPSTSTATGKRDAKTGAFVLGRGAFARVSAVERIAPSARLEAELHRLRNATPEHRRATLSAKYGKN